MIGESERAQAVLLLKDISDISSRFEKWMGEDSAVHLTSWVLKKLFVAGGLLEMNVSEISGKGYELREINGKLFVCAIDNEDGRDSVAYIWKGNSSWHNISSARELVEHLHIIGIICKEAAEYVAEQNDVGAEVLLGYSVWNAEMAVALLGLGLKASIKNAPSTSRIRSEFPKMK